MTRVNALLQREIGEALFHVLDADRIDIAAITVTHVITNPNLREARVLVSIRSHESERGRMLDILNSKHGEIQALMSKHVVLKYTPRLTFAIDTSVERGDRVLNILSELGTGGEDDAPAPAPGETPQEP